MKKILTTAGVLGAMLVITPMFAAFEAHVVNVTATIENALSVNKSHIKFGTVFPQENLKEPLEVKLSQSFMSETRVDDVDYFIRQKPKCGITSLNGTVLDELNTKTGHVKIGDNPATPNVVETHWIDCGTAPRDLANGETWGVLPDLCPYISKHGDKTPENDGWLESFHIPWRIVTDVSGNKKVVWLDTKGHLAKSARDIVDNWIIDLAVPCFGGYCAQDWEKFVKDTSGDNQIDPSLYVQDKDNEHKVFGCDLWIEVGGISLPGIGCKGTLDMMLVMDESGSIEPGEMTTMKNAAKAFVDVLAPTAAGVHMGQTSFSTLGSLDLHLTDDVTAIKAAIDGLSPGGFTNLYEGILFAKDELANPGDGHDRADGGSPDYMVILTDGAPNEPGSNANAKALATSTANMAKAAGTVIYVVGIGTTSTTRDYLMNEIATSPSHYFDAADFDDLEAVLKGIAECKP